VAAPFEDPQLTGLGNGAIVISSVDLENGVELTVAFVEERLKVKPVCSKSCSVPMSGTDQNSTKNSATFVLGPLQPTRLATRSFISFSFLAGDRVRRCIRNCVLGWKCPQLQKPSEINVRRGSVTLDTGATLKVRLHRNISDFVGRKWGPGAPLLWIGRPLRPNELVISPYSVLDQIMLLVKVIRFLGGYGNWVFPHYLHGGWIWIWRIGRINWVWLLLDSRGARLLGSVGIVECRVGPLRSPSANGDVIQVLES
jgi:hypothetical protein